MLCFQHCGRFSRETDWWYLFCAPCILLTYSSLVKQNQRGGIIMGYPLTEESMFCCIPSSLFSWAEAWLMMLLLTGLQREREGNWHAKPQFKQCFHSFLLDFIICTNNITRFESFEFQFPPLTGTTKMAREWMALLGIKGDE